MTWIRSSACTAGNCVEAKAEFTKSSQCSAGDCAEVAFVKSSSCSGGSCVEAGDAGDTILMRDSKDPEGPQLKFSREDWTTFLEFVPTVEDQLTS